MGRSARVRRGVDENGKSSPMIEIGQHIGATIYYLRHSCMTLQGQQRQNMLYIGAVCFIISNVYKRIPEGKRLIKDDVARFKVHCFEASLQ